MFKDSSTLRLRIDYFILVSMILQLDLAILSERKNKHCDLEAAYSPTSGFRQTEDASLSMILQLKTYLHCIVCKPMLGVFFILKFFVAYKKYLITFL